MEVIHINTNVELISQLYTNYHKKIAFYCEKKNTHTTKKNSVSLSHTTKIKYLS